MDSMTTMTRVNNTFVSKISAKFSYRHLCSVDQYITQMMGIQHLLDDVAGHAQTIGRILGNEHCNVSIVTLLEVVVFV